MEGNTAISVCDVSYQPNITRTSGSTICIIKCVAIGKGAVEMYSSPTKMGLYKSLANVLATTILHNISKGSLQVEYNNEVALFLSSFQSSKVKPDINHVNIIRFIHVVNKI